MWFSYVKDMEIRECKASEFPEVDIVFSGLSNQVAGDIEEEFAASGKVSKTTNSLYCRIISDSVLGGLLQRKESPNGSRCSYIDSCSECKSYRVD